MKERKNISVYEIFTAYFIVYIALTNGGRGVIWIKFPNNIFESAIIYRDMSQYASIEIWGFLFLTSGILLFLSAFTHGCIAYILLVLGGLIGTVCHGMMFMAGTLNGINLFTPFQSGLNLVSNLIFICIGGILIWKKKRNQNL